MRVALSALFLATAAVAPAVAAPLLEPALHVAQGGAQHPNIALTFDACDGRVDSRILNTLVSNGIPATIFVTAKWLKRNAEAAAVLRAHPELFDVEDHGARHVPAVDKPVRVYGIAAAGSPAAVEQEAQGGAAAIRGAGFAAPKWFRGATAKYTASSMREVQAAGLRVAGYSVNGDSGAVLSAAATQRRFEKAKDGDVIIAHINQPQKAAGAGVVRGLLALKARGVNFVRLDRAA